MFDSQVFAALQKVHERIKDGDPEFDREDPTPFVRNALGELDITRPEEFHAHVVARGEGLPNERPHGAEDREIYFLKLDGSMEYHFLKGQWEGLSASALEEANRCCFCKERCCVVEI